MNNTLLKTNPVFDAQYKKIESTLKDLPVPDDFELIYDVAKRLINQYGLGTVFIEKLYVLGVINGAEEFRFQRE